LLTLGRVAATLGFDDLVALVRYILVEPGEIEAALLRDVLKEIMSGQEARIMSIAVEQWKAEGKAEGIQIGKAVGKAEGKAEGKADMLLRFLRLRFGVVPETTLVTVMAASEDQLNEWAEKVLDAPTLEGVFAERRAN
jgi:flagellar biosynthesis/type III secretory pathway protein FliH